jgi:NAD(P)-dependent dehydrogenase (short-subunit alcohol dehydrogenase family)
MEFGGKVALVTGAGSGLGEATAKRLASEGARVGVLDINQDRVKATCDAIIAVGGRADPIVANVADEAEMKQAVDDLAAAAGRLDIVIVNAGINGVWAPIDDLTPAEWDRTHTINLRGSYLTIHFTVPHLKAAGGGNIVILSSINGTRVFTTGGATAYTATKAAQAAMASQLAIELARYGIRVNAVCPGHTRTNIKESTIMRNRELAQWPLQFPEGDVPLTGKVPAEPSDIADAIRFLCSSEAKMITGAWLHVDGGQSLVR